MVLLRYGSLTCFGRPRMDITRISRITGFAYGTVHAVLTRFEERDYRILPSQRKNCGRKPKVLHGELKKFLLSPETLDLWAGFNLKKRSLLIQQ